MPKKNNSRIAAKWWGGTGLFLLVVGGAIYGIWSRGRIPEPSPISPTGATQLPDGLSDEFYNEARVGFFSAYGRVPSRLDALSFAAELALSRQDYKTAVACFGEIPSEDPGYGHLARYQQGFSLLKLKRANDAETQFREFLQLESREPRGTRAHHRDAMQRLRHILEVELRFQERHELLRQMHQRELAESFDTIAYCFPGLLSWNGSQAAAWCEEFWEANPADPLVSAALARYRAGQGRLAESSNLLNSIPDDVPTNPHVVAARLYLLSQQGDWPKMAELVRDLPPAREGDPWLLLRMRGLVQNRMKRFEQAEACYRLVLKSDPANAEACQGLARAVMGLGRGQERDALMQKAENLGRIQNRLGWVKEDATAGRPLREIADLCRMTGLTKQARLIDELIAKIDASLSIGPAMRPQEPGPSRTGEAAR